MLSLNARNTAGKLARLSATPAWAIFSTEPAVVLALCVCIAPGQVACASVAGSNGADAAFSNGVPTECAKLLSTDVIACHGASPMPLALGTVTASVTWLLTAVDRPWNGPPQAEDRIATAVLRRR